MTAYCEYVVSHPSDIFTPNYYNTQYGFPLDDDNLFFERLLLEVNQAGLSWITILKKGTTAQDTMGHWRQGAFSSVGQVS